MTQHQPHAPLQNNPLRKLDRIPDAADYETHIWADYLELLCLVNLDGELSVADTLDRVRERRDDLGEAGEGFPDDEALDNAEYADKWDGLVRDWFDQLLYRQEAFGDNYPFVVSNDGLVINRRENLGEGGLLYIFLLLSANLRYSGRHQNVLTRDFELLSSDALQSCLPAGAQNYVFGTTASNDSKFRGSIRRKIETLASELGEKVIADLSSFPPRDAGDGGLDLLAIVPVGDMNSSRFAIFGQCACTEEWITKKNSSSFSAWRGRITLTATPPNFIFIPHCYRRSDGAWHKADELTNIVLIDRARFLYLMRDQLGKLEQHESFQIASRAFQQREDVV